MHRPTLGTLILGTSIALAGLGCSSDPDDTTNPMGGGGGGGGADAGENELELFSWWTAPGEAEALQALIATYKDAYPGRRVTQVTNSSAVDALTFVARNIEKPQWDVAQLEADWVPSFTTDHPDALLPVDDIYADPALKAAAVPDVLDTITIDGNVMGVITGLHRKNALHYNKQILDDHEIALPDSVPDFLAACEKLKAEGVEYPVALSLDGWVLRFLTVGLLQGILGPSAYSNFVDGKTPLTDPTVKAGITEAIDTFVKVYTTYADIEAAKAPKFDWSGAASQLYDGKAAMYFTGDFSKGYLIYLGWTPGVDFGVSGPPGARDLFEYGPDVFTFPANSPHPTAAHEFLTVVASKEGQVNFNKYKGSTPMRTDVRDMLDDSGKESLDDLVNATIRTPANTNNTWDSAMVAYVGDGDRDALLEVWLTTEP